MEGTDITRHYALTIVRMRSSWSGKRELNFMTAVRAISRVICTGQWGWTGREIGIGIGRNNSRTMSDSGLSKMLRRRSRVLVEVAWRYQPGHVQAYLAGMLRVGGWANQLLAVLPQAPGTNLHQRLRHAVGLCIEKVVSLARITRFFSNTKPDKYIFRKINFKTRELFMLLDKKEKICACGGRY